MSLLQQLRAEYEVQQQRRREAGEREATTTIGGETVTISDSNTGQSLSDSYLTGGANLKGVPRGREAYEARQIARTQPMQVILNAIVDQLTGGELAYPSDDEDVDQAEADLQALVDDILRGPHLDGADFDDLVAAAVADMVGPGNAYLEVLAPDSGDLPVAALKPVDPLTVRHNVDETRTPQDPPYFQAPFQTLTGSVVAAGNADPTPLQQEDLVVMAYPGSYRSDRIYPLSPAMQVKEWLEVIADSTTHHSRFYKDNELPPGLLTAREATQQDLDSIKDELEAAKGDPRAAPVVGTDARWVEVGGSAVDLNVIEEQKWFMRLCAAAFGIPQTELGMVEDVNRAEGDNQLSLVHKRVTKPLAETVGQALARQLLPQFDLYTQLDQPFGVSLQFSDPRQERAHEEFVRDRWSDGLATYREVRNEIGEGEPDDDTTVSINGTTIDYGEHPRPVVEALLIDARNDDPPGEARPEAE
ncbi:MAG: phage portal protein [Haloarculaceae archaeon]